MLKPGSAGHRTPRTDSALGRLLARRDPATVRFGRERIDALLGGLGRPERDYPAIHVAGTNGKGSVAATAEALLRTAGHRTGLYTSPHVLDVIDRIAIDGRTASAGLLETTAREVLPLAESVEATYFEAMTALALAAFSRAGVDVAVVEVGLGGRLDATNVLDAGVAVITSIDLDHAAYLGSDPAGIAREKAGIIAPGATVVLGEMASEPRAAIQAVAEGLPAAGGDRPVRILAAGEAIRVSGVVEGPDATAFVYTSDARPEPLELVTRLPGGHQARNAALALAAVDAFEGVPLPAETVRRGLASVRWPGRFDVRRGASGTGPGAGGGEAAGGREATPTRVYDIAHNPAAAELLAGQVARALERGELSRPVVLLAAVLGDKDWPGLLGPLLEVCDGAVFTDAPSAPPARRWDPREAARELAHRGAIAVEPDFDTALRQAKRQAGSGTVLVTGSSYTVGDGLRRER